MSVTFEQIVRHRIIPIVVVNDAKNAAGLGDALGAGGLPVAEVMFRTPAAEETLKILAGRGDLIVGAGTVRSVDQVKRAVDAGATFLVSPGTREDIVRAAQDLGVPILPGAVTSTEVLRAEELGVKTVKYFPANVYGGASAIKALAAPFNDISFVPSGGINDRNVRDYLAVSCIAAVGSTWMVPTRTIDAGDFATIESLVSDAVEIVRPFTS